VPRAKKTLAGGQGQASQVIKGQTYGEGVQQQALQAVMPAPQANTGVRVSATQSTAPSAPQGAPMQDQGGVQAQKPDLAALLQQLKGVGGQLNAPDDQPDRPFNTGLPGGVGNEIGNPMRPYVNRTAQIMRDLSARTGDPIFANLAARARL
jgi:hypothetical protein